MKKELRGFVIGVLVTVILMSTVAFGAGFKQKIEVMFNSVNLAVNGRSVEADNILYKGTTYVPIRAVAEMLGKEVGWDGKTNTASIVDSRFEKVIVSRHVDGDTVYVKFDDGREEKVRFIGVDTPETVHPSKPVEYYGQEASDFTKNKLLGKTVYLEKDVSDRDKYGRLLRYVWLKKPQNIDELEIENNMFNAILVKEGYAQISTFPPDVKYVDYFSKYQKEAREQNKGLWKDETSVEEKSDIKKEGKYVGSIDSDKFHNPNCRWAKKIKQENEIWFDTIEEAKKQGYKPCGVCKPK